MKKTWSQTSSEVGRGAGSTSHLVLPKAMAKVKKIILFQRSVPSLERLDSFNVLRGRWGFWACHSRYRI